MLDQSVIISLIILFLHATTWDGHIFAGIRNVIDENSKLSKPLYNCPICMTPWWGSVIYWIFLHESFSSWVLTVGAAAGLSVISVILIKFKDWLK